MSNLKNTNLGFLSICILFGLLGLGWFLSHGIVTFKQMDRTVTVKGLAEQDVPANIAIWPIRFNEVSNDLTSLYGSIQKKSDIVVQFLKDHGFDESEITIGVPAIQDRQAGYYDPEKVKFRYISTSTVTVYSEKIDSVIATMKKLVDLGQKGIAIMGQEYGSNTQFLFTKLNDIKPSMIEEATKNARVAAEKFAADSESELGKIKNARQGQFSIRDRDSNTPYIKTVRVVTSLEYYLSD